MLYTCLTIGEIEGILCRSAIFKSSTRGDTAADKSLFARCCGQAGSDKLSGGTWEVLRRVFPSAFTACLCFFCPWATLCDLICDAAAPPWQCQPLRDSWVHRWPPSNGAAARRWRYPSPSALLLELGQSQLHI